MLDVGYGVTDLRPGHLVVCGKSGLGTWQTHLTTSQHDLLRVSSVLELGVLATLTVTTCTAHRMLRDFATFRHSTHASILPRDPCANPTASRGMGHPKRSHVSSRSSCHTAGQGTGAAHHQYHAQGRGAWQGSCDAAKLRVLRKDRPDADAMVNKLTELGATHVLDEADMETAETRKWLTVRVHMYRILRPLTSPPMQSLAPALALNCVGGKSASNLTRIMAPGATMVTYGGMSKRPLQLATVSLESRLRTRLGTNLRLLPCPGKPHLQGLALSWLLDDALE